MLRGTTNDPLLYTIIFRDAILLILAKLYSELHLNFELNFVYIRFEFYNGSILLKQHLLLDAIFLRDLVTDAFSDALLL